jgi:hypothetical protein
MVYTRLGIISLLANLYPLLSVLDDEKADG